MSHNLPKMSYLFKSRASFEAAVDHQAMEATEQIMAEMGAELHDDLIQRLSIFRLYLDRLDRAKADPAETEFLITSMNADFQEVVQSVRRISRRLMSVKMENDSLEVRVQTLCQNMERPGGGTIHFSQSGTEPTVSEKDSLYLTRIVQELIHNALKHSSAWHVDVRLCWVENTLLMEVEDDGTAFSKVNQFIDMLEKKYNTLRMRSKLIGAKIHYTQGRKGLLARVEYLVPR